MMENTLEHKAKVFALYWGQNVMCFNDEGQYTPGVTYEVMGDLDEYNFLELKPISSISDEDFKRIVHIKNNLGLPGWVERDNINPEYSVLEQADYLRSKGYALPAFGLSVEELVNRGWIKLV